MFRITSVMQLMILVTFAGTAYAQPTCTAMPLSDQDIKTIVDQERSKRSDLPTPFDAHRWVVRRQECHYVYVEYALPRRPEGDTTFTLNQHGVIVDVQPGNMKCPDSIVRAEDLAETVRMERLRRTDLPAPFAQSRTRVSRVRCGYLYIEYAQPDQQGTFQIFRFDALGELMGFIRPRSFK
jgi:hypothetical protein